MAKLDWADATGQDIARLRAFLAPKSRQAAERAIKAILRGVRTLARHPEIGRPWHEGNPEYREWPIHFGNSGYLVLYRYDGDTVFILALRHAREAGYSHEIE